jgi:hypothetical protein
MPTQKKKNSQFECLILFEGGFTSFIKDKKSQNSRNQGFSSFLLVDGRNGTNKLRIRVRIQEAQKHTDQDPNSVLNRVFPQ